jgi:HlyD family secretion protein
VRQVRLEPLTEQNVVTYTTVIDVANPALKLKPGMTANVTIRIEKKDDVLRVPNAALRFRPPEGSGGAGPGAGGRRMASATGGDAAGGAQAAAGEGRPRGMRGRRPGGTAGDSTAMRRGPGEENLKGAASGGAPEGFKRQVVHVLGPDGKLVATRVATGITDGTYTEVRSRELTEGALVVTGAQPKKGQAATTTAPPGMGGPGGQRGGGGGGIRRF